MEVKLKFIFDIANGFVPRPRRVCIILVSILTLGSFSFAQQPDATPLPQPSTQSATPMITPADPPADRAPQSMFPRMKNTHYWLTGQANLIFQTHPEFPAPYSGPHSLLPHYEKATSRLLTLYTGYRPNNSDEFLLDVEEAGGAALSLGFGLAGNTDLDIVRNPLLGKAPYLGRGMYHHIFPLSKDRVENQRSFLSLFDELPRRRLEFRIGKFSMPDFFDINSIGGDTHFQFINWTTDNNGAWDYAADTRGYTVAAVIEYAEPRWSVRGALALMPTVANGLDLDWDLTRARGENLELEVRPVSGLTVRALGYRNHANMGRYQDAIDAFLAGADLQPDVTAHRAQGRIKWGGGLNVEYATGPVRLFGRAGANEGEHESFAYTEVNGTWLGGGDVDGIVWHREHDRAGAALVSNALSSAHQEYLRLGGLGFLLGDSNLTYGRETIFESYYTAHMWRGVFGSVDIQHVVNPGYNRDRGPVTVAGFRLHIDF